MKGTRILSDTPMLDHVAGEGLVSQPVPESRTSLLVLTSSSSVPSSPMTVTSPLDDTNIIHHVMSYIGCDQYRFVAMIDRRFKDVYEHLFPGNTRTSISASTIGLAKICFEEVDECLHNELCCSAATHGDLEALKYLRLMDVGGIQ
jgi:hypothetical protein